ncbi:MAG: OmpH family outer membrane protein, partial [Flavobacteriaceae bacterium]|nr:OmpH family outer membrane protein [Flavobacteriaceae bacterium]
VNAQDNIAHIDAQKLIEGMPEMKSAQAELEKVQKSYEADMQTMATELQNKMKLYNEQANTVTQEENEKRVKEVQGMETSIRQYQSTAQQELQKKEIDLLKPIMEKARQAIQKVAKAQGYKYVLDSTSGSGIILADGKDLMADVKKELGI